MDINHAKGISANQIHQYEKNESLARGKSAPEDRSVTAMPQEKVDLSTAAREIQQMKNALNEIPEVRENKVADLKSRIDNGTYDVSGEEVAKKMMGELFIDLFA